MVARLKREVGERIGHCCGCRTDNVKLTEISKDRWRCKECVVGEQVGFVLPPSKTKKERQWESHMAPKCPCGNQISRDNPDGLCGRCRENAEQATKRAIQENVLEFLVEHFETIEKLVAEKEA